MADTIYDKLDPTKKQATGARKQMVRGPGGQLQDVTGEEVQTLSQALGRPAPPTSPIGGAAMGLSPDAAKMMGDGRQKAAALDIGMGGEGQLQRERRTEQARTAATEEESATLEKSQNLERLQGLGDRVHNLISSEFSKMQASTQEALSEQEIARRLNLGESLEQQFAAAGEAGAEQAIDYSQVNISDDIASELGFADTAEISSLLGQDVSALTVDQISELVDRQAAEEFSRAEDLRSTMNDPQASPAMREEARRALRDMGALGTLSAEEQVDDVQAAIEAADTINVGGREYELEELLSDEGISASIEEYASLDEEGKARLREQNPEFAGLYDFADGHSAAIEKAIKETESRATTIKQAREERKRKYQGTGLSSDLLEKIYPDWDKYGEVGEAPTILKQFESARDPAVLANKIRDIEGIDPELMEELKGADEEILRDLGLMGDNTAENRQRWEDTRTVLEAQKAQSFGDFAGAMGLSAADMQMELDDILYSAEWGGQVDPAVKGLIDSDNDGKMDDWNTIANRLDGAKASELRPLAEALGKAKRATGLTDRISSAISSGNIGDMEYILQNRKHITPEKRSQIEEGISSTLAKQVDKMIADRADTRIAEGPSSASSGIEKQRRAIGAVEADLKKMLEDPRLRDDMSKDTIRSKLKELEDKKKQLTERLGVVRMDEAARESETYGTEGRAAIDPSLTGWS